MSSSMLSGMRSLLHPYYLVNLVLSLSFLFLKLVKPFCFILFDSSSSKSDSTELCELDMRENEILFFLLVIIMIRSRKSGAVTMAAYLSSGFVYAKVANVVLFFRSDPRYGLVYLLTFIVQAILLPEPTYKGPENLTYFRSNALGDELARDKRVTWLVCFYAAWSPSAVNFAPTFAKLSAQYDLPNLKFGKIDVGRYPDVGAEHFIDTSARTRQLPTVIMFQNGEETGRVPAIISGKVQKFMFKEDDLVNVFDLNNLYADCKKDKKLNIKMEAAAKKTQ